MNYIEVKYIVESLEIAIVRSIMVKEYHKADIFKMLLDKYAEIKRAMEENRQPKQIRLVSRRDFKDVIRHGKKQDVSWEYTKNIKTGIKALDIILEAIKEAKQIVSSINIKNILGLASIIVEEKLQKQGKSKASIARYKRFFKCLAELLGDRNE